MGQSSSSAVRSRSGILATDAEGEEEPLKGDFAARFTATRFSPSPPSPGPYEATRTFSSIHRTATPP